MGFSPICSTPYPGNEITVTLQGGQWGEVDELRKRYVAYQYRFWRRGIWDYDLNTLENYCVTEENEIQLVDIDIFSVTNNYLKYPYSPTFYSTRHKGHWKEDYRYIADDFIAPVIQELGIDKFNQIVSEKFSQKPRRKD